MSAARKLDILDPRPRTRGECASVPRPCPFTDCRYHLEAKAESCALDVADKHDQGLTLEAVADLLGVTPRVVREIEHRALRSLRD